MPCSARHGHVWRGCAHVCLYVCTFNGGIVLVDEMGLDELDGQTTLADTTTADDDQLVFPEELRHDAVSLARAWLVVNGRWGV